MNVDGSSRGSPGTSACGGIFRDSNGVFLGAFAFPIGISTAFRAELNATMKAIDLAALHSWSSLWLETDSTLVHAAFNNRTIVPWDLRNQWDNCILLLRNFPFYASHIYWEGNVCADALANHGLALTLYKCWELIPLFLGNLVHENMIGRTCYRFPPSMG